MKYTASKFAFSSALALLFALSSASATDGTWISTSSGATWSATSNWSGGNVADGAGSVANFSQANVSSSSARSISFDMNTTLGVFIFGDPAGTNKGAWTLNGEGTHTLTFNNNGSTATLSTGPGSTGNPVKISNVNIYLADSLQINAATSQTSQFLISGGTISASTTGLKTITNTGTGTTGAQIAAAISDGAGQVGIVQDSATSNLTLTGSNTFTGGVTINAGAVTIGSGSSLGSAAGVVTFNGGALGITSNSSVSTAHNIVINSGGATLQGSSNSTLTLTGAISGTGSLTKAGNATNVLILTGANSYVGVTTVSAGTLLINGDQSSATGSVSVAAGAILGGSGVIGGATAIADGATLAPGAGSGTSYAELTFDNGLAMGGDASVTVLQISGATRGSEYDAITIGAGKLLAYDGVLQLNITSLLSDGTYDLYSFTSGLNTGNFDSIEFTGGVYTAAFSEISSGVWQAIDGEQTITFTIGTGDLSIVPEPATLALAALGLLSLGAIRRGRRDA